MANNPDVDLSGLSATELVDGLRVTLRGQQLTTNQQALMQEIARRTEQWGSMQQQLQSQSTLLSQLQSQLQNLTVQQQAQQVQQQATMHATAQGFKLKVERPSKFSGEPNKLNNWLFSLEQYFVATGITDVIEKAAFGATLLDGKALTWWRGVVANGQVQLGAINFKQFERLVRLQFVDVDTEFQLRRRLYKLVQTKSVGQYISTFRHLVLELGSAAPDEQNLMFQFVEGLKPAIRTQVLIARPKKLQDAMQIAERTDTAVFMGTSNRAAGNSGSGSSHVPMELGKVSKRAGTPARPRRPQQTQYQQQQQSGDGVLGAVRCWYCDKDGHVQRECFKRARDLGLRSGTPKRTTGGQNSADKKGKKPQRGWRSDFKGKRLNTVGYSSGCESGCDSDAESDCTSLGLEVKSGQCAKVKLADGKVLNSSEFAEALVDFGQGIQCVMQFQVLSVDVTPILGFTFLDRLNPKIDWQLRLVKVCRNGHWRVLKTIAPGKLQVHQHIAAQLDACPTSCSILSACEDVGGLKQCALLACLAVVSNLDMVFELCSTCGFPQVADISSFQPKINLQCNSCGCYFKSALGKHGVCNPFVSLLQAECAGQASSNSFASLDTFTINDIKRVSAKNGLVLSDNDINTFLSQVLPNLDSNQQVHSRAKVSAKSVKSCTPVTHAPPQQQHVFGRAKQRVRSATRVSCVPGSQTCEQVSYRVFKQGANKGQYQQIFLSFVDQVVAGDASSTFSSLNFTHRSAYGELGAGDTTTVQSEGDSMLQYLKQAYPGVFEEPVFPIERQQQFTHKIELADPSKPPPKRKLYPLDQTELAELKTQIQLFLETNRIVPSSSPYGAPILFARKKDGRLRMCIDYRQLNANTVKDSFPLPRIDELMQRLDGAKYFSKLDLRDGYHQIQVEPRDQHKTAFTTHYGTYEWLVMPFGLCNAPSTFQRVMNHVFFDLLDQGVLVYLDDVLIYSKSIAEHKALLDKVFSILNKHKLYVKESKCSLFLESVEFLGVVLDKTGIRVENGKVDAVLNWPVPSNITELQQFLGLCNYYRKFVFRFSELAMPLTRLTRKNVVWLWGQQQQQAFDRLKQCLTTAPTLKVFDSTRETRLVCDASDFCVGAVLEQKHNNEWHPVEFLSKRLSQAEQNMCATDREFVAIILALEKLRQFLIGQHFTILTDHAALTYLQTKSSLSRRQARWLDFLAEFDFVIQHVPGKRNVADYFSRVPGVQSPPIDTGSTLGVLHVDNVQPCSAVRHHVTFADDKGHLLALVRSFDPHSYSYADVAARAPCTRVQSDRQHVRCLQQPLQNIEGRSPSSLSNVISIADNMQLFEHLHESQSGCDEDWFIKLKSMTGSSGVHYRSGVLCKSVGSLSVPCVPSSDVALKQLVLRELHETALGGHLGGRKLHKLVQNRFYWPNMRADVDNFVRACQVCQQHKSSTTRQQGLLQPLGVPQYPWQEVTIDFIVQLPVSTRGFDAVLTVVDRFSKYVVFVPCHTTDNAQQFAQLFFEHIVCVYGMPEKIVSDRDVKFTSKFWQALTSMFDCRLNISSAYHPQTDGQSERFNRSLEQVIRCYCSSQQQLWCTFLCSAMFALNSTVHAATSLSPYYVLYSREPRLPLDHAMSALQDNKVQSVSEYVQSKHCVLQFVKEQLAHAQDYMTQYANKSRKHVEFSPGDFVLLSSQNLQAPPSTTRKLLPKFVGPFEVLEAVGKASYRLALPPRFSRLHPVFHVSQLRAHIGRVQAVEPIFQDPASQDEFEVAAITGHRGQGRRREYLVQWLGYPAFESTWEPELHLSGAADLLAQYKAEHGLS